MTIQDIAQIGGIAIASSGVIGLVFKGFHDRNADAHGGVMGKVDILIATTTRTEAAIKEVADNMKMFQEKYWEHMERREGGR